MFKLVKLVNTTPGTDNRRKIVCEVWPVSGRANIYILVTTYYYENERDVYKSLPSTYNQAVHEAIFEINCAYGVIVEG